MMDMSTIKAASVEDVIALIKEADALIQDEKPMSARTRLLQAVMMLEEKKDVWKNPIEGIKELREVL